MAFRGLVHFEGYQLETQFVCSKIKIYRRGQFSRSPLAAGIL
jgi:hypothetical protein